MQIRDTLIEIDFLDARALGYEENRRRFYTAEASYLASLALDALTPAVGNAFDMFEVYYRLLDKDVNHVFEMFDETGGTHAGRLHGMLLFLGQDNWPDEGVALKA